MKKTLLMLGCVLSGLASFATTNIQGEFFSNTTWTKANSPYVITGHTRFLPGTILNIDPGVEIRFDGYFNFFVDGSLVATGNDNSPIIFTSNLKTPKLNSWKGIEFRGTLQDSVLLRNCNFSYGESLLHWSNTIQKIYIGNCSFEESQSSMHVRGYATITSNKFYKTKVSMSGILTHNQFIESQCGASGIITENMFYNTVCNASGDSDETIIRNNKFIASEVALNLYGYKAPDKIVVVEDNLFAHNKVGLFFNRVFAQFNHNTFKHNVTAIKVGFDYRDITFNYNCIDSNTVDITNNSSVDIDFSSNYWGTTDSATIRKTIQDYYNDFVYGKVTYSSPLPQPDQSCQLSSASPWPTSVKESKPAPSVAAYPNPFNGNFIIDARNAKYISIYNAMGTKLYTHTVTADKTSMDMSVYPAGLYIYIVTFADNTSYTGKLQKL